MFLILLAAATVQAAEPRPMFRIGSEHRLIEGVASDGRTIFVSSVIDRTVLACRTSCRVFARLPDPLHPLGLTWDSTRQRLWIAADCPPLPGFAKCDRGALVGLDRSGRIRERLIPEGESFHSGDVSSAGGNIFIGDAMNGAVYWLKPGAKQLGVLLPPKIGKSAQGSALDASGQALIVADYSQGVASINLATGKRTLLLREDGKALRGVDGLARCGDRYIGVFNGAQPNELLSFAVKGDRISVGEIYAGPALPAPTQLAFHGGRLLIAGDGDWDKALKPASEPHGPFPVRSLGLREICLPKGSSR